MIDDADKFLDEFLGNQPKTPKAPTTPPAPKLQPMKKPKADINSKIDQYSSQSGVDPNFVRAVMGQESGGNPNAKSWANAKGLLQIIPETGKKYRKDFDPFNVDHNLEVGTKHLAYLEKKYKGDKKRVLAAYNAGEGNADKENWYEQSQRWSNDPAVQKGLKPRGPSDKTNTRNYIDKIMRNYEKMGGTSQSAEDTFLDSFLGTSTEQAPIQGGTVSPAEIEFATPENLKKYGFEMPQTAPTPTVQGTQTVKQPAPSSVPTILQPNYPEQIAPKPGQLVLGGQDGEQLVQDDDQANVNQGEVRVKDKTGKKFLARQTKDKGYSVTPEVQYSNEDVEAGYSEYLGYTKEADTPETKQKYLSAIKGNVTTGTVEGYSGQMQPASAQAGLTAQVNDNYAKQVEQERSTAPAYYFTHPAEQKVKEIKTDADFLQTVAANVAIDISNKPSGMNLGEYLLRTALKANQPKYGYSDEGIERAVQATKQKTGKFTATPYPDFTDDEFPEAVNQFKRQYESRYVNMGLTRGIINDALGGNDKQIADSLAIEKPQVVKEIQNPFVLPNSVNRLTEEEARQKTIEEIKNPKLSTQFERAAKDAATKGFSQLKGLVTPFLLIPQMIDDIKAQYSNVVGTVPEESERIASELAKKKATFGSFADYQQIQQTRQEMDTGEYAVRLGAEVVRGATRLMVADSLKGLEVVGDFAEDLNPLSYILPDEYQPSVRNLGNLIGFTYARIQNPNLKYSDMPGMDSSIDKRLFYNIGKSVDEALGDDKYLRDTFGGALAQGMGSAAGFLLMGMVAPQAAIGARFSLSSAALGGLTSMGSGYSEARENKLTETQSKTYAFIMGLTGASEGFGVGSAVSRSIKNASLRKMFLYDLASYIKARGKNFADEGLEEFAQEFFQSTAGASSLAAIKDKEPDAYQRILNIFNRLPKQMGDAAVDAGSVAFLTGGLMGSTAGAIADRGRSNEGFRINEKSRRIEIEGVVMDYAPSLDPTIKSWKKSVEAMEDAYAEVGTLKNAIKNAKTPEAKVDAVRRLLALEKEVQGLSDQSARLLHRISSNVVPVEGQELKPVFDPEIDTVAPEVQVSTPEVTTEPVAIPKDEVAPVEVAAEAPEITEAKPIEPTVKPTTPKTPKTPKPEVLTEPAVSPSGTPKAKTGKVNRVIIEPKVNIAIQSETGEARSGTNPNGSTWTEVTTTKEDGLVVTKYNTVKPSGTKLNTGVRVTTVDDLLKEFPVIPESFEELEEFRKKYGEEVEIREVRDMAGRGAIDIVLTGKEKYTDYKMSVIFNRNDVQPKTETKPAVVPTPKVKTEAVETEEAKVSEVPAPLSNTEAVNAANKKIEAAQQEIAKLEQLQDDEQSLDKPDKEYLESIRKEILNQQEAINNAGLSIEKAKNPEKFARDGFREALLELSAKKDADWEQFELEVDRLEALYKKNGSISRLDVIKTQFGRLSMTSSGNAKDFLTENPVEGIKILREAVKAKTETKPAVVPTPNTQPEKSSPEKAKDISATESAKSETVTVGDKQYTLTPDQQKRWDEEVKKPLQKWDEYLKQDPNDKQRQSTVKGIRMQVAAVKREIVGALTDKEQAKKDKKSAGNYIGKPVSINGQNGTVVGNVFGKTRVQMEDGSVQTVEKDAVGKPINDEQNDVMKSVADDGTAPIKFSVKGTPKSKNDVAGMNSSADFDQSLVDAINDIESDMSDFRIGQLSPDGGTQLDVAALNDRIAGGTPLKSVQIEDFAGIPVGATISDQLRSGDVTNPFTGRTIDNLMGGIGFNATHPEAGWANTTQGKAKEMISTAEKIYNNNKDLFDALWAEGKLPDGIVPFFVVKMGEAGINSNEAVRRTLIDNLRKFPVENRRDAVQPLHEAIEQQIDALEAEVTEISQLIRNATSESQIDALKTRKTRVENIQNQYISVFGLTQNRNAKRDIVEVLQRLEEMPITLPVKADIANMILTGQTWKPGQKQKPSAPQKAVGIALMKGLDSSYYEGISQGAVADTVTEPALRNVPSHTIVAAVGVDVKQPKVIKTNHPNYPFGVQGVSLGIFERAYHAADVFGEGYAASVTQAAQKETATKSVSVATAVNMGVNVGQGLNKLIFRPGVVVDPAAIDALDHLNGFLRLAFPRTAFFTNPDVWRLMMNDAEVTKFARLQKGDVIGGFTKNGNVFINPAVKTDRIALHEVGHVFVDFMREYMPDHLAKGFQLVEGTTEYDKAKKRDGDTELAKEEALVELMATKGANIVNAAKKSRFKEWLVGLWGYVKNSFTSLTSISVTDVPNLTLEQFLEGMLADVLSGKELVPPKMAKLSSGKSKVKYSIRRANAADVALAVVDLRTTNTDEAEFIQTLRDQFPEVTEDEARVYFEESSKFEPLLITTDELVQTAQNLTNWRDWYDRYQGFVDQMFGEDASLFKSFMAATSQGVSVASNVALALKAYRQYISGEAFTGYLGPVIKNLDRAVQRLSLRGQKIGQFEQAAVGDTAADDGVAVDRHIVRVIFGARFDSNGRELAPTPARVRQAKYVIIAIAKKIGWQPRQVQAALWAYSVEKGGGIPESYDYFLKQPINQERFAEIQRIKQELLDRDGYNSGGDFPSASERLSPTGSNAATSGKVGADRQLANDDSILKSVADIDGSGIELQRNSKGEILAPNGKVSNIQNEGLAKKIRTPEFIEWFGDSQVVDENGEPLMLFSGHGNLELYGDRYQPKKGTAGAFYATESQDVASSYSIGKMGNMEEYEQGSQYLFKQKNGKFAKKISQIEFTPEQQKIADEHIRSLGYDIVEYWKDNRAYDADARRALARGGLRDVQSIFIFLENMGENIWYADHQDARPMFQKQDKSEFEKILDKTGIEWQSRERSQPGVFPIFLSVQNPLDAAKPFPSDLLKALQKKASRIRDQFGSDGTQWTKDYPMKEWVERIENGDEYWTTQIPAKALEIIREFGYDGVKELGNKGESDRNKRQVNWLAFEPNQIKSIFNEGTFSGDNDSILKKVADTEARTEQERLQSVPLSELLDGQASFDGNNVELDIKAAENLRRHMAELSFRQKGKEVDESAFDGILAPKSAMKNIVELLQETYDTISLPEYGYSPEEIAGHKSLLDAMKQVAADQDFGVFYVFEEALPEELFHKEDFMSGRTDAKALTAISESKLWNIANAKGSKFNRHYGKQSAANRLSELVAKLATGQEKKYGFADAFDSREEFEDARDNLLIEWAEGILRNNPEIDLTKFERINKYVEAAENKRRSSDQPSIGEDIGSGQTGTGQQGQSQKSDQQSDSRAESQDETEDGEVKLRVPKYAEKSLDTDEITYEQESMKTTKAKGEALRRMQGIDSILEQIRAATGDLPAMMSALYQEQTRLNDLADQFAEEGKMAEKDAVLEQLASLSSDIVSAQIQSGRAVNIAKTLEPLSAENALNVITRLKQRFTGNENEGLSAKGVQEIKNIQSELSDTTAKLKRATRKVDKLREQIKTGVSQSRKSSGNRVRRVTQVQKAINEKLNANYQDLLAQLKLDIDQEIMKMVAWHGSPHSFDKFDIGKIGTGEGEQAFGYGLYFTDQESIAEHYQKTLTQFNVNFDGKPARPNQSVQEYQQLTGLSLTESAVFSRIINRAFNDTKQQGLEGVKEVAQSQLEYYTNFLQLADTDAAQAYVEEEIRSNRRILDFFDKYENRIEASQGAKYRVDLKPEEDEYLLWDKPLSEQSEKVLKRLGNVVDLLNFERGTPTAKHPDLKYSGSGIYGFVSNAQGSDKAASEYLKSLGIRGIKYLDGTSRNQGEGSYNYVIFDSSDIQILEVNGTPITLLEDDAANAERLIDALRSNIESARNGSDAKPLSKKGFSALDVPAQNLSLARMFKLAQNLKVQDAIIEAIPVDVMNLLKSVELTPKMLLHQPAVFRNLLSIDRDNPITGLVDASGRLGGDAARTGTESGVQPATLKLDTAGSTDANRRSDGSQPALMATKLRLSDTARMKVRNGLITATASVLAHTDIIPQSFDDADVEIEEIFKSVTDDTKLPEDAKEAIANIGAKILNDGLMSDTEFDDKEFAKAIEKVFTKNYAPFTDEIIALSFDRLIEVRAEALKERMIAQMVEDGMSETEAKAETDKKLAEKKASAKTRAQSIASIRKIANRFRRHKATVDAFEDKTDNADVVHAGIILTEMKPLSMNVLITMLQKELSLTPDRALQVAKEAKKLQDEIAKDKKAARDEARGMLPDALEEERTIKQAQQIATRRMNDVLRAVTDDANLMKRFNNDFRAKLVLNHATQLFNAVQSVLPVAGTMSGEIYTDAWDTAIRAISRKMGRESELDGIAPNVGPLTMLMPYGYLFSNNRQLAEGILAAFPDDYFRMELGILPDVNLDVTEVRGSNFISKGLHKWFDGNQKLNEFLANITFAKKQEAHFRSLTFVATLDQLARNKGTTLKELLETKRPEEAFTEPQIRYAVDKALRVTFAEQMDDRIGRSLKRTYDQLDHYLPVLLNPFVYARFTYTVSRAVINAHTFGVLDSESLGGPGYNTRSTAKGFYGLTAIGIAYALLAAFGGDDDKWHHLYLNGKENPPIDIRRFFPFSAYVYTAYLIKRKMEGRDILARETLGTTFAELAESYASFDPDQYGRSPGVGVVTSLGSDTEGATLKASAKLLGNFVSGFMRFFRPIKMLTAQIDQDEASFRNYDKTAQDAFVGQMANNLPFISSMYNADKRTDPITGKALTEVMPIGKMVGLNFVNPMFVAPKPTPAAEQAKTLFPYSGPSSEMTPEEREAYTIRREFKEAVRKGEKTLTDLEPMIQKYTESGKLSARSAQILRKSLLSSDLIEILKARFSFGDEKDVKKIRRVWEKANPLEQTELTALLKAKRDTARKNKDGKALQRAVELLKELGIK